MPELIIMRGVPGCGKSTRALELAGNTPEIICSADHYYGETAEEYLKNWHPEKIGAAHEYCQQKCERLCQEGVPLVIVDNTNTVQRDVWPYLFIADRFNYDWRFEYPTSPWWVDEIYPLLLNGKRNEETFTKIAEQLGKRTLHGVPTSTILKMLLRFDTSF